ncbi:hypothetical protein [Marisediminicola senii]|uniref:hypothetical protein n=1 Tax=Marisediminicola senii TaxID=2711233 RepID=UPI0013EA77A0|nr:hypothetical protein [Marisediminicola senii]
MGQFDQFANQGGAAAWDPAEKSEATRVAEEQLQNADYSGGHSEPLGSADSGTLNEKPDVDAAADASDTAGSSTDEPGTAFSDDGQADAAQADAGQPDAAQPDATQAD